MVADMTVSGRDSAVTTIDPAKTHHPSVLETAAPDEPGVRKGRDRG